VFQWNPGDDDDIVEGQAGFDTLDFNGAAIAEQISISANGARVLFTRDIATVAMDLNDVEQINFRALGGKDIITINDLAGTDVTEINIDLGLAGGAGDGEADRIVINATNGEMWSWWSGMPQACRFWAWRRRSTSCTSTLRRTRL
jgi:hypothetical protein